ncbi:MAG: hypothetical protein R3E04_06015 [Sphingobium sp.]
MKTDEPMATLIDTMLALIRVMEEESELPSPWHRQPAHHPATVCDRFP